jgi:hypothetical protein
MREMFIWNVRLNRAYDHSARILIPSSDVSEALPYAIKYALKISKDDGNREFTVSTLECEGSILVPSGVSLTQEGQ